MTDLPRNPSEFLAEHDARIVLTVYCGQCVAEHRKDRGPIGRVLRSSEGVKFWHTTGRRRGVWLPAVQLLAHPRVSQPALPETLLAACRRHGVGSVATTDVLSARDTVVLLMNAPA
jgi:hypothetical protein